TFKLLKLETGSHETHIHRSPGHRPAGRSPCHFPATLGRRRGHDKSPPLFIPLSPPLSPPPPRFPPPFSSRSFRTKDTLLKRLRANTTHGSQCARLPQSNSPVTS